MNIPAALSAAMVLRGFQTLLMDLLLEPEFAADMISFAGEVSNISIEAIDGAVDIDGVLLTGAFDNLDMIGPDAMREFSLPRLRASERRIHGLGLPVMFHPHGALTSDGEALEILDEMLEIGFECMYYGETIDPETMKRHAKGKCSLCGGIDTFTSIYLGPDERVHKDVSDHLARFDDGCHIFSPSCSVDRGLPLDRMEMMMRTVRNH
jgi:uroporphyrinogen decarboxylase